MTIKPEETKKGPAKDLSNMQLDKNFKLTTEEVTKDELMEAFAEGAQSLLPVIDKLTMKQLRRVLSLLVFAPVMEHPTQKPKSPIEAIVLMNFLRLQDYKIALVELIDQELEEQEQTEKELKG